MRFSVIIPIYGIDTYLRQCLDSLLVQTYKDFEAILIDDGSKDNCPKICDEYAEIDSRFKVIHKINGGRVCARQVGAELAIGEYIICIDGDDWVSPYYLEHFNEIIETNNPDVILCDHILAYPDHNIKSHSKLRNGRYNRTELEDEVFPYLIYSTSKGKSFPAQLWAKAFRRTIYIQNQLTNVVVEMGEDRACVIAILYNSYSIYVADFCDYYYRQIPTSITKAKKPFREDGPKLIYGHIARHLDLDKYDLQNQLYQGTCHSLFNVCKSQFYSSKGYLKTRKQIDNILNDSVYIECIRNVEFEGSLTRKMMHYALKFRLYFLMYIYSKL